MTPLDLRIKYRFETGYSPTYGEDAHSYTYKGALTHYYAEWIENKGVDKYHYHGRRPDWKRWRYLKYTGKHATYRKGNLIYYTKGYKEWLEESYCEANTIAKQYNLI